MQDSDQPLTGIRELQSADEVIGPVLQSVISGKVPEASFCKGKSREFNQLVQQWEQLLVKNGVLFRHREDAGSVIQQVVVPKAARSQVLKHLHEGAFGGHLGEAKTLGLLRERFYRPGFSEDSVEWCKTCRTCAARKNPSHKSRALSRKILYPSAKYYPRINFGNIPDCEKLSHPAIFYPTSRVQARWQGGSGGMHEDGGGGGGRHQ